MKSFFTLFILLVILSTGTAFSQSEGQSVTVYLKNGSAVRGTLVGVGDTLRLETYDRSLWVFQKSEVDRIVAGAAVDPNVRYKHRGFVHYTEVGPLAMSNRASNGVTTSAFSFQITNGYKFNQWAYAGLGIGADLYAVQTFVPVVLSLRGDLSSKGSKIPFYFVEGGYGFNATSNDVATVRFGGGATGSAGLGLKVLFNGNTGFVISAGYRYQRSFVEEGGGRQIDEFNRLTLRAGFSF